MFFARYQFTVFSSEGKRLLSLNPVGWMVLLFPLLLGGLAAGNVVLVREYNAWDQNIQYLEHLDDVHDIQSQRLLQQTALVNALQLRLGRIIDFNAKLRVMLKIGDGEDTKATLQQTPMGHRGLEFLPALYGHNHTRHLRDKVEKLGSAILEEEVRQQSIAHAISAQLETLATIPVIMPTMGRFSSPFGWRTDPFTGRRRFHKGIDLTARTGTPVRTTANGLVTQVTRSSSYGLVIVVTHSDDIKTRYAHLSKFAVEEGQRVIRGQLIGHVGNTGRSKAPHLHYEVHFKGRPANPRNYILQ